MDHLIAKGVDKALQFVHRKRIDGWSGEGEAFVTEGNRRRFTALASMIVGRDVEVTDIRGDTPPRPYWPVLYKMAHPALRPEHGFGWSDGETIFLPVSMVEMEDEKKREDLMRLLLFFLALQTRDGAIELARRKRSLLEGDRLTADLFWIIENTRLFGVMREEYPGVVRQWPSISSELLEKRPAKRYLSAAEQRVEAFLKETIEATGSEVGPLIAVANAEESLAMAIDMKKKLAGEGVKVSRYRAIVPFLPWGKLIPGRVKDAEEAALSPMETPKGAAGQTGNEKPDDDKARKRARYAARKQEVDEEANENGLTLNIYDKILSWAEFINVPRPFDDDPDADPGKKADECEELSMADLERTTANTFNADLEKTDTFSSADEAIEDTGVEAFYYPEWDYKRSSYRPNHARLVESAATELDRGFSERVMREKRGVIKEGTRNLEMLTPSVRLVGRRRGRHGRPRGGTHP